MINVQCDNKEILHLDWVLTGLILLLVCEEMCPLVLCKIGSSSHNAQLINCDQSKANGKLLKHSDMIVCTPRLHLAVTVTRKIDTVLWLLVLTAASLFQNS